MKLYELTNNYKAVWDMIENDESDQICLTDTLQAIEGAIEEKAHNIAIFIRNLEVDTEILDAEIKRLQARKKSIDNRSTSIKNYLHQQMEVAGIDKVKTATFTISLQNNPASLAVFDEKLIPSSYITVKTEYVIDKNRIKEDLKNGVDVPGAGLVNGKHLRIR